MKQVSSRKSYCLKCDTDAKLLLLLHTVTLCRGYLRFYSVLRKRSNPEVMANKVILRKEGRESFLHAN